MPKLRSAKEAVRTLATLEDVKRILGDRDESKMVSILAARPTVADVEEASMWLAGDLDVFGPGRPLKGIAAHIVTIVTENEEEEPPPRAG
jgi:hypothetical protein